jgi:hypothetical protein
MRPNTPPEDLEHEDGSDHLHVGRAERREHQAPGVVLEVDVEDGQHDELGEDEDGHAAEADAAVPQHRRQRHVADRADD